MLYDENKCCYEHKCCNENKCCEKKIVKVENKQNNCKCDYCKCYCNCLTQRDSKFDSKEEEEYDAE